jgi:hypothetical protein
MTTTTAACSATRPRSCSCSPTQRGHEVEGCPGTASLSYSAAGAHSCGPPAAATRKREQMRRLWAAEHDCFS